MKKKLIQYVSVLLSFLAGLFLTSYLTQVGNRDMTTSMAEAVLPVLYAETEGTLYNEMHGYRTDMDGGYMKDSVIAVQEDHVLKLALEKYNAQITDTSYEVKKSGFGTADSGWKQVCRERTMDSISVIRYS